MSHIISLVRRRQDFVKEKVQNIEGQLVQVTGDLREKVTKAVIYSDQDVLIAEVRRQLNVVLIKLESEVAYFASDPFSQDKLVSIHKETMKLIELDDLQLQIKLALDDKEAFISNSKKLKSQIIEEEGYLGILFSLESSDRQQLLETFELFWIKRLSQIENWFRTANATLQQNSEIYLEKEIKFNLHEESILRDTLNQFRELLEDCKDSPKSLESAILDLYGYYERMIQLSRPE
jgi:hypothetical protein